MEYLKTVLGVQVEYKNFEYQQLPNFIRSRYNIQKAMIDNCSVFFLYPKTDLEQVAVLKKHIARVQTIEKIPVIFILEHLTYRQREYLIRDKIPFVVDGKQIYLPFMAIYLQERCDAEKLERENILPSAQMLLLYFIYHGAGEMPVNQAVKDLELTPTSISRASCQLEDMGLIKTKKVGVQKIIYSDKKPQELFETADKFLVNPVKRCVYIPEDEMTGDLLKSGYLALADYSMLNFPAIKSFASSSISRWNHVSTNRLQDSQSQVAVEFWKYDPSKLSDTGTVDRLSLALALKDDNDERVEETVEEMLTELWRKIDGNRN